jgi:diguanylate cyclase (GGDEF)-like protein/PAS domain S-box-containing protein
MPFSESAQRGWFNRLRRLYQSLSLTARYALFLGLSLALLWAGIGREVTSLNRFAEREVRHDVINLSQAFAEEVGSTVGSVDLSLIALRSHWRAGPQQFRAFLADLSRNLQDKVVFQIAITDARGVLLFSSADAAPGRVDLSDREHIRAQLVAKQDKLFIGLPVLGRVSHKWSVQFTRPIFDERGAVAGVIVASVEPSHFSRFYDRIYLGPQGVVSVIRTDGVVLARSSRDGKDLGVGAVMAHPPFGSGPSDANDMLAVSSIDGITRMYSSRVLPEYGLAVSVGQSMEDGYARYAGQRKTYFVVGIAISLLLAVLCRSVTVAAYRREQLLRQMADAEARWKFALEGAGEGVWDWDIPSRRAQLSPRVRELLGIEVDAIRCDQDALRAAVHPEDVRLVNHAMQAHLSGVIPSYMLEHRVRNADGGWRWVLSRGMVVERAPNGDPLRMVGTFSDISERKQREEQVRHLAQHDALTGLPNRALLSDRLRQAIRVAEQNGGKLALIYFDLDRFKPINDSHGHETGDLLLKEVARRAVSCLRHSDTVARLGGDEFVALLPDIAQEADAMSVAANLLAALCAPFSIADLQLEISSSLGVAAYPADGNEEATLLRCADRAMYQAKQQGRGRICRYRKSAAAIEEAEHGQ